MRNNPSFQFFLNQAFRLLKLIVGAVLPIGIRVEGQLHIRRNSLVVDVMAVSCEVSRRGNFERGAVLQVIDGLDNSLAVGLCPQDCADAGVLNGAGEDLRGGGTVAVDVDGFTVRVDDKGILDGGSGTLVTGYKSQGTVNLTFTPAKGADQEVVDGGVNLKMEIAFENNRYNARTFSKPRRNIRRRVLSSGKERKTM